MFAPGCVVPWYLSQKGDTKVEEWVQRHSQCKEYSLQKLNLAAWEGCIAGVLLGAVGCGGQNDGRDCPPFPVHLSGNPSIICCPSWTVTVSHRLGWKDIRDYEEDPVHLSWRGLGTPVWHQPPAPRTLGCGDCGGWGDGPVCGLLAEKAGKTAWCH